MAAKGGSADRLRRRLMAGCAALAMVPAGLASGIPAVNARGWQAGDYGLALLRDGELALASTAMTRRTSPRVAPAARMAASRRSRPEDPTREHSRASKTTGSASRAMANPAPSASSPSRSRARP